MLRAPPTTTRDPRLTAAAWLGEHLRETSRTEANMAMTRKQRKALLRHKANVKRRNIRTNNLKANPWAPLVGAKKVFRLYDI